MGRTTRSALHRPHLTLTTLRHTAAYGYFAKEELEAQRGCTSCPEDTQLESKQPQRQSQPLCFESSGFLTSALCGGPEPTGDICRRGSGGSEGTCAAGLAFPDLCILLRLPDLAPSRRKCATSS